MPSVFSFNSSTFLNPIETGECVGVASCAISIRDSLLIEIDDEKRFLLDLLSFEILYYDFIRL